MRGLGILKLALLPQISLAWIVLVTKPGMSYDFGNNLLGPESDAEMLFYSS